MSLSSLSFAKIKESYSNIEAENLDDNIIQELLDDSRKNVSAFGKSLLNRKNKHLESIKRMQDMYRFDRSFGDHLVIAGVDEVGRGPLAGPIVGASVIIDHSKRNMLEVRDSKKLSHEKRCVLAEFIKKEAIAYCIYEVSEIDIDNKGIAFANNEVLLKSYKGLKQKVDLLLSDGFLVKQCDTKNIRVIKGDDKSISIAAASIIAKVYRDEIMVKYAKEYPQYGFESNVGYGSKTHIEAIRKYGPCKIHRKSFIGNFI